MDEVRALGSIPEAAIADRRISIGPFLGAGLLLMLPLVGLLVARGVPCSDQGLDCLSVFLGGGVVGPAVGLALGLAAALPLGAQRAGLVAPALVGSVLAVTLAGGPTAGVPALVAVILAAVVARLTGGSWRRPAAVAAVALVVAGPLLGVAGSAAQSALAVTMRNRDAQHRLEASGLPLYAPADRTDLTVSLSTIDPGDPSRLTVISYWVRDKADGRSYVVRISGVGPACDQSDRERVGDWLTGTGPGDLPTACRADGAAVIWINALENPPITRDDVLRLAQDLRPVDAAWMVEHAVP